MMWIIIPKSDGNDVKDWSVTEESLGRLLIKQEDQFHWEDIALNDNLFEEDKSKWQILILNTDQLIAEGKKFPKDFFANLEVPNVFVHFGRIDLSDFTSGVIQEKWEERMRHVGFEKIAKDWPVMPFSSTNFPGSEEIGEYRRGLSNVEKSSDLKLLRTAWSKACTHFNLELPSKELLDSLYPLAVDLDNHQRTELSEVDLQASLDAAKASIEKIKKYDLTFKLLDQFYEIKNKGDKVNPEDIKEFVKLHRTLSQQHTQRHGSCGGSDGTGT